VRGGGRWLIACAVALPLVASSFAACTTTTAACDCASSLITVNVPADIASSVTDLRLSGPACTSVTYHCANPTNGCTAYDFTPNGAGDCDIEVVKADGNFTATVSVVSQSGCCAGFYPSPSSSSSSSSGVVDVPEPGDGG
jgi:hypothetical protein